MWNKSKGLLKTPKLPKEAQPMKFQGELPNFYKAGPTRPDPSPATVSKKSAKQIKFLKIKQKLGM